MSLLFQIISEKNKLLEAENKRNTSELDNLFSQLRKYESFLKNENINPNSIGSFAAVKLRTDNSSGRKSSPTNKSSEFPQFGDPFFGFRLRKAHQQSNRDSPRTTTGAEVQYEQLQGSIRSSDGSRSPKTEEWYIRELLQSAHGQIPHTIELYRFKTNTVYNSILGLTF